MEWEDALVGLGAVAAGLSFAVFYTSLQDYRRNKLKLEAMQKQQTTTVSQARREFRAMGGAGGGGGGRAKKYLMVMGSARKLGNSVMDVLYSETKFYSIFASTRRFNFQGRSVDASNFLLEDLERAGERVLVQPTHNTLSWQLLHKLPPKKEPWYKQVLKVMAFFALSSADLTEPVVSFVKEDDVITVCGFLEYNSSTGELFIESPDFLFGGGKTEIINYLSTRKNTDLVTAALILVPGLLYGYWVAKKLREKARAWWRAVQERRQQREFQQHLAGIKIDGYECIICMDRGRNVIFLPCKHFSVCQWCAEDLLKPECPVCKLPVVQSVKLFLS